MKVAIIGAGFTGLAAAKKLLERGHKVTVYEAAAAPGGLAAGFKNKGWAWPLEMHYHHIFESDRAIRRFASSLNHKITFRDTTSSILTPQGIFPLDSPSALMAFPGLGILDKLRVAAVLGYLRLTPFWKPLEKVSAKTFLKSWMGERAWRVLWQDLFQKKFGKYYSGVPASWFWARIKKRSKKLGYPEGAFTGLAEHAVKRIRNKGGLFYFNTSIKQIVGKGAGIKLKTESGKEVVFDRVICTLPSPLFAKITLNLPKPYIKKLNSLRGIGAVTLVVRLKRKLLDGIYWLNVGGGGYPFLALVEHTNFINKGRYNGETLIYIGNYLDSGHRYFSLSKDELLKEFIPYLSKVNKDFRSSWVKGAGVFKTGFAQPIITLNYSRKIPKLTTPIKGLYLANIQQVYPWDRGTNYAVELGEKVAELIE
jgi:protoporphyrinogen oxidase